MEAEKLNGTKVPDWILNLWVEEDREVNKDDYKDMFNNPQKYNLIKE